MAHVFPGREGRLRVAVAGDNAVAAVDIATLKMVATIPVGQVPKRDATAMLRR